MNQIESKIKQLSEYINGITAGINDETILYHYTDIYGLEGIIKNRSFWLTQREYMNDIVESDYSRKIIIKLISESKTTDIDFDEIYKRMHAWSNEFILSLSLEKDSIHQWNYYSKGHGYCIAFKKGDLHKMFLKKKFNNLVFGPVIYKKEFQEELLKKMLSFAKEIYQTNENYEKYAATFDYWLMAFYGLFKQENHSCEKEFRIIVQDPMTIINHRIKNYVFSPYIDIDKLDLPIKEIWLGPKLEVNIATKGLNDFLVKNKMSGIDIIPSEIKMRET